MTSDIDKTLTVAVTILLGYLGAVATVVDRDWPAGTQVAILLAGGLLVLFAIGLEVRQYLNGRPIYRGTREDSHAVTARLVRQGGRTVVFTVGLSFTENSAAYDALIVEAGKNSVTLMLPRSVQAAQRILENGGDVRFYGEALMDREWEPQTRFTVVPFGEVGSTLYIGRDLPNGRFVIERYHAGTAPHAIAQDLINYVRQLHPHPAVSDKSKQT